MMIRQPTYLKKGDKIAIVCPAKNLPHNIDFAILTLQSWGLEVVIGASVKASFHQFAGKDELRAADLQGHLDDPEIKAIIAARGGYGTLRIIDLLNFEGFVKNPKWLIGFSDITVLLSHSIAQLNTKCLHAPMPYTFEKATPESLKSLENLLFGIKFKIEYDSRMENKPGFVNGVLIGGNLSLLCALQGSVSEMDFTDKILFLEEVGEHEYAVDRMVRMLDRAGKLKELKALIVGAFSESEAETIPFGQTTEEIIFDVVKKYEYPVCFNFPTGHIYNNMAMMLGEDVSLEIESTRVKLTYL